MNVIFLDIDGVLNSKYWNETHEEEISEGKLVDEGLVKNLGKLIEETEARIILHSGWKYWFDENIQPLRIEAIHLKEVFWKNGISISGVTPDLASDEIKLTKKFSKVKADEILSWLKDNPTEKWIVLDDLDLHNEIVAEHQIKTDANTGLTDLDVNRAREMLET